MEITIFLGVWRFERLGELMWMDDLVRDEKAAEEGELFRM